MAGLHHRRRSAGRVGLTVSDDSSQRASMKSMYAPSLASTPRRRKKRHHGSRGRVRGCGPSGRLPALAAAATTAVWVATLLGVVAAQDEEPGKDPLWLYFTIPFVSAIVGWGTNVVALKMTFFPIQFVGCNIKRYACGRDQPVGCIGWQGIVPTKAPKISAKSVDLMTKDLFNIQDIFNRLDPTVMAEELAPGMSQMMSDIINQVAMQHLGKEVKFRALEDAPAFVSAFMGDVQANLDDVFDLKFMVVDVMTRHPELLNDMFLTVGKKEIGFIERSGFYFGFLFGILQAIIFYFANQWWIMPLAGLIVGYATNYLALKMIFSPIDPHYCCCGRVKIHGLFLQRQYEVAAMFAQVNVRNVLNSRHMWMSMLEGPKADKFVALLRRHSMAFTDRLFGPLKVAAVMYLGAEGYVSLKRSVADNIVRLLPNNVHYLHEYTDATLDMETELREKMRSLTPAKFEGVLHPAFEEDELKLILVGAVLGAAVGFLQVAVVFTS